jgi:hypothetical protein
MWLLKRSLILKRSQVIYIRAIEKMLGGGSYKATESPSTQAQKA